MLKIHSCNAGAVHPATATVQYHTVATCLHLQPAQLKLFRTDLPLQQLQLQLQRVKSPIQRFHLQTR